jgi:ribosomal-protein-alanine N-acetyltransferase
MNESDLDRVMEIELAIYTHPWTRGNFLDSIQAGYDCRLMEIAGKSVGYGVQMVAVKEAHLLNLSIAGQWQGHGYGRSLLMHFVDTARQSDVLQMFLEVRPSNEAGRRLYSSMGFVEVAVRPGYYPTPNGREDAILMGMTL